jgi:peptide/nickel transport system substrate-binding protein
VADDKTLEFKLRKGIKFHDGSEMKADDVVFTFDRITKANAIESPQAHTSPRKGLIEPLTSIEKTDDYTVVMHFKAAWPVAMQMIVHQQIASKAYVEKVGPKDWSKSRWALVLKFVSAKTGRKKSCSSGLTTITAARRT